MRTAAIVNPHSAAGKTGRRWREVESLLASRLGPVHVRMTERAGQGTEAARALLLDGFERIIAVGGDGTCNEVANGFLEGDVPVRPEACLGLLPLGTGGDLQRSLGIPKDLPAAVEVLARATGRTIDMGKISYRSWGGSVQSRYFVNLTSFGMGGEVAAGSRNLFSRLNGKLAFLFSTLRVFVRYRPKRVTLAMAGAAPLTSQILNVAVGNGPYHGGGMYVCPLAQMDDGMLEITVIDHLGWLTLLRDLPVLYSGKIYSHPKVRHFRTTQIRAEAAGGEPAAIEVDGEPVGTLPAEVSILPGCLRVLAPEPA